MFAIAAATIYQKVERLYETTTKMPSIVLIIMKSDSAH